MKNIKYHISEEMTEVCMYWKLLELWYCEKGELRFCVNCIYDISAFVNQNLGSEICRYQFYKLLRGFVVCLWYF